MHLIFVVRMAVLTLHAVFLVHTVFSYSQLVQMFQLDVSLMLL
jgi:hypothetical protein